MQYAKTSINRLAMRAFFYEGRIMKEQFEKWVMVASSGNADLTLNIHGEYDSPETSGFYELYKLARADISQALTGMEVQLANAESKCTSLAAENLALKESHAYTGLSPKYGQGAMMDMKKPFIDKLLHGSEYYSVCGHISAATNRAISAVHGDYSWMPETPATDVFLAEVRAQGVEMAACALDGVNQFNYANMLDELAQKIRKGAAQ